MMDKITKTMPLAVERSAGTETRTFTISCGEVDRDGDQLVPSGVLTQNYFKNPVVLWSHTYDQPPIGRTRSLRATMDDRLEAVMEFAPTSFAQEVRALCDAGFLKGASVGFSPIAWTPLKSGGLRYDKWEILEWSVVAVPSNPFALMSEIKAHGLHVPALTKMLHSGTSGGLAVPATWIRLPKEAGGWRIRADYLAQVIRQCTEEALAPIRRMLKDIPVLYTPVGQIVRRPDGTCVDVMNMVVPCPDELTPQDGGPPVMMLPDGRCLDAEGVPVPCGDFKPQPGGPSRAYHRSGRLE